MKLALVSVSDKSNLSILANFLLQKDYHILSTGGSYKYLLKHTAKEQHSKINTVENFTGFPEILEGRVKTLHPKIYGGILYNPDNPKHQEEFRHLNDSNHQQFNLEKIDLIVCNLYPFAQVAQDSSKSEDDVIENIDIGGVCLLRAAAKNYQHVFTLCNPNKYSKFMENYQYYQTLELFRKDLASEAWEHIAEYDQHIASHFNPRVRYRKYTQLEKLKYGCNPYQDNAYLSTIDNLESPIEILNGNPGYINFLDAFQSWLLVSEANQSLGEICAASFKHTAPAGVGLGKDQLTDIEKRIFLVGDIDTSESEVGRAFLRARNCDPLSSFGDFVAVSGLVDTCCAKLLKREVSDGIIALGYTEEALEILKNKKKGKFMIIRGKSLNYQDREYREIFGLSLSQRANREIITDSYLDNIVTSQSVIPETVKRDLLLTTITLKYTPSNSISFGLDGMVIGVGAGQQNRVDCVKLAGGKSRYFRLKSHPLVLELYDKFVDGVKRQDKVNAIIKYVQNDFNQVEWVNWRGLFREDAEIERLDEEDYREFLKENNGVSLSSDAFMPFRDNIDVASKYGVSYIIQPGGSVQDESVIAAAEEYGMTMVFTGKRMFLH